MANCAWEQLRVAEKGFNQIFEAESVLDVIWPERKSPVAVNNAYLHLFLDPLIDGKILTKDDLLDDSNLFEKAICYVGESELFCRLSQHYINYNGNLENGNLFNRKENRMNKVINAGLEMIMVTMPVSSKEIAENLEFVCMEEYKWQMANCDHGKCSMKETYLLNSVNA